MNATDFLIGIWCVNSLMISIILVLIISRLIHGGW